MRWSVAAAWVVLAACAPEVEVPLELEPHRPTPADLALRSSFDTPPAASCLVIAPSSLSFGTVRTGCTRRADVELHNRCAVALPGLRFSGDLEGFTLDLAAPALSLPPLGSSGPLAITFAPTTLGRVERALLVTEPTGAEDLTHVLALSGTADVGGAEELVFSVDAGWPGAPRRTFFLTSTPAQRPTVTVNEPAQGIPWSWDAQQNAIVFDAPPPAGSLIVVRYEPACAP
jgi:hypothetical protein